MGNQQERLEIDLAWLAALIEGEGWVSLALVKANQKNKEKPTPAFQPNIGVVNTDLQLMDEVIKILSSNNIRFRKNLKKAYVGSDGRSRKEKLEISITIHSEIRKLINLIIPYMRGAKKNRCIKLLEYFLIRDKKPRSGKNAAYGKEEYNIYKELYSYKGNRSSRSRILNDYTLEFENSNKI